MSNLNHFRAVRSASCDRRGLYPGWAAVLALGFLLRTWVEDHLGGGRKGGWQPDERSGRSQFVAGRKGGSKRGKGVGTWKRRDGLLARGDEDAC